MTEKVAAEAASSNMETAAETLSWAKQVEADKNATIVTTDGAPNVIKDTTNAQVNEQHTVTANDASKAIVDATEAHEELKPPPPKKSKSKEITPIH